MIFVTRNQPILVRNLENEIYIRLYVTLIPYGNSCPKGEDYRSESSYWNSSTIGNIRSVGVIIRLSDTLNAASRSRSIVTELRKSKMNPALIFLPCLSRIYRGRVA